MSRSHTSGGFVRPKTLQNASQRSGKLASLSEVSRMFKKAVETNAEAPAEEPQPEAPANDDEVVLAEENEDQVDELQDPVDDQ